MRPARVAAGFARQQRRRILCMMPGMRRCWQPINVGMAPPGLELLVARPIRRRAHTLDQPPAGPDPRRDAAISHAFGPARMPPGRVGP